MKPRLTDAQKEEIFARWYYVASTSEEIRAMFRVEQFEINNIINKLWPQRAEIALLWQHLKRKT